MSPSQLQTQAPGSIADGLAGPDPRLASMLTIFSQPAAGEEMPVREKTRARRGRPAGHRPRRARRHPRRGIAFPQPRRLHARLGWQQAIISLVATLTLLLVAVAGLGVLNTVVLRPGSACTTWACSRRSA